MDDDYLSRPLIEGMRYEISNSCIMIQCPHTCFINYELPRRWDRGTLLLQYRRVLAMAKAQGVRISYTLHIHRTLRELWPEYETACAERERLFARLKELAQEVKARGIHVGTADDDVLAALLEVSGQLTVYGYRDNPASRIARIGHDLAELERELSRGHEPYSMIAV